MSNSVLEVRYRSESNNDQLFVRGQSPFSWERGVPMERVGDDLWRLEVPLHKSTRVKILKEDREWSVGENFLVRAGRENHLVPTFEQRAGWWNQHPEVFEFKGSPVRVWIYFPPSYNDNLAKHYPVLYCQDGQTLFDEELASDNSWAPTELGMDESLSRLMQSGMMEEIIVVGIEAREHGNYRMDDYTPFVDSKGRGGEAGDYLGFLVNEIKGTIDATYRTLPDQNGVMGSSLGGLFAFYAGRALPQVFSKVACVSSSFWWAHQEMLHRVEISDAHDDQKIYMDASLEEDEDGEAVDTMFAIEHALLQDGYRQGIDLLTRRFRHGEHNELAWGPRVNVPLQFLYPWQGDGALA